MKEHLLCLARYHAWSFRILFDVLSELDEARYRAPCGLFFGSVHATLNHLLVADLVWHQRLANEAPPDVALALDRELYRERSALQLAIERHTPKWQTLIAGFTEVALASAIDYRNLAGKAMRDPLALTLAHVFNHATHHRGQISAALTGTGLAAPEMDLIYFIRQQGER